MPLSDAQAESMMRIAGHCATRFRWSTPHMSMGDRREAAMTGLADYLLEYGWPDTAQPLYEAANRAIGREASQGSPLRHLHNWGYWHEPPSGRDHLAEAITDKIAIWQVCWALTGAEWAAVWAVAEVMKSGGGLEEAAALLGLSYGALAMRLQSARCRGRQLWVAPGEQPGHHYRPNKDGGKRRLDGWRSRQRQYVREVERMKTEPGQERRRRLDDHAQRKR